jgi:hypothetical protein
MNLFVLKYEVLTFVLIFAVAINLIIWTFQACSNKHTRRSKQVRRAQQALSENKIPPLPAGKEIY